MNITCQDREGIFLDGSAEQWAALEQHAASCAECAEELTAWKSLSVAAGELRDYQENSALWARIEIALRQQQPTAAGFSGKLAFWRGMSPGWQTALAGAVAFVLAVSGVYVSTHRRVGDPASSKLLGNSALAEVHRTEREYRKAIDKLAADAKPQLEAPSSPLLASYREKLVVLDSAIDELEAEAAQNPSNAHLRYQLLAMYQAKQQTLEDVLETKP
jgi:hypothetical protein